MKSHPKNTVSILAFWMKTLYQKLYLFKTDPPINFHNNCLPVTQLIFKLVIFAKLSILKLRYLCFLNKCSEHKPKY